MLLPFLRSQDGDAMKSERIITYEGRQDIRTQEAISMPRRTTYLMACGHTNNALYNGGPACAGCGCYTIMREVKGSDGLEGRTAECEACRSTTDSKWALPFFRHRPYRDTDLYYCGCRGWD